MSEESIGRVGHILPLVVTLATCLAAPSSRGHCTDLQPVHSIASPGSNAQSESLCYVCLVPLRPHGSDSGVGVGLAPPVSQAARGSAGAPDVPPEAKEGLHHLYAGDPDAAIASFRALQQKQPDEPLAYLLEVNARWWKIYCDTLEIKWGMIDAWKRPKRPEDQPYFALAEKAIHLAEKQMEKTNSAEMQLYAGMGYALEARLYGLRYEKRATAHAGVKAREHLLRALQLNPNLADADTGLGLYNYYVDTLSPIVKMLRVFMGIPGGNKREGIRQLETAMAKAQLTAVEARFYLADNMRIYAHDYARSITLLEPLTREYPHNAIYLLLLGDLEAKLGHNERAAATFHAAEQVSSPDAACASRVQQMAKSATAALR